MKRTLSVLAIGLVFSASACARRVVIDPELVAQRNDPDWKVKSAPEPDAGTDLSKSK